MNVTKIPLILPENLSKLDPSVTLSMKSLVHDLQTSLNLQFIYVRLSKTTKYGGLTIAYSLQDSELDTNVIWVSLAWCTPTENFNKLIGKYFAATRYADNYLLGCLEKVIKLNNYMTCFYLVFITLKLKL